MRCFLSYSYNTDISTIKHLLSERNISYVNPIESLEYGTSIMQTIQQQIKDSDFIIAVLDDSTNVSIEIGIAFASKKPIFVIIPEDNKNVQANYLSALTHTIANPNDYDKIKYNFDFFINQLPKKEKKIRRIKSQKRFKGVKLSMDYVTSLGDIKNIKGLKFEKLVSDIFRKLEIEVLAENRIKGKDFQADFSLWLSEIDSIVGNPIIVETKSTSQKTILRNAVEQLSYYLNKYNLKVGLLIYSDTKIDASYDLFSYSPLVISISITDLLNQLTEKTLAEIIIQLRNKAVHKENY